MVRNEGEVGPYRVLFVCTGNTCRSPLAEALAAREIERRGWSQVEVASAGVSAYAGQLASEGALRVAERRGLDLSGHRSRPVTRETLERADLVLVMSPAHAARVRIMGSGGKVSLLTAFADGREDDDGAPVSDPFGGGDEEYEATYDSLEKLVVRSLDRLEPVVAP